MTYTPDDLNFEGAIATIAARNKTWFTGEMHVEELTGEVVNDAVYDRDLDVEDRLNVTINYELLGDANASINTNVTAGTDYYTFVHDQYSPLRAGYGNGKCCDRSDGRGILPSCISRIL